MATLRFDWDPSKSAANVRKHGVSFEEAESVFYDEHAVLLDDPDHSGEENRFVMLGVSLRLRILVACHCYRSGGSIIRLISARRATRQERETYRLRWRR